MNRFIQIDHHPTFGRDPAELSQKRLDLAATCYQIDQQILLLRRFTQGFVALLELSLKQRETLTLAFELCNTLPLLIESIQCRPAHCSEHTTSHHQTQ